MPRTLTPYKAGDLERVRDALHLVRFARDLCAAAGAPQAVKALNRARKSVEGAVRHVDRRRESV